MKERDSCRGCGEEILQKRFNVFLNNLLYRLLIAKKLQTSYNESRDWKNSKSLQWNDKHKDFCDILYKHLKTNSSFGIYDKDGKA